jgi:Tfp pilus assembly protein PilX
MKKQQGIILVIMLIVLIILSLLSISVLESSVAAKSLVNIQTTQHELFVNAESELQYAENQMVQHPIALSALSQLITDQQLLTDQIPAELFQSCTESEALLQKCYLIELLAKENCNLANSANRHYAFIYRVTVKVSCHSLIKQSEILQSTYIVLPATMQQCQILNSLTDTEHYLYAGRQSWREIN